MFRLCLRYIQLGFFTDLLYLNIVRYIRGDIVSADRAADDRVGATSLRNFVKDRLRHQLAQEIPQKHGQKRDHLDE